MRKESRNEAAVPPHHRREAVVVGRIGEGTSEEAGIHDFTEAQGNLAA
ncbi:hypothetical protein [Streptomyces sp. NPDC002845]